MANAKKTESNAAKGKTGAKIDAAAERARIEDRLARRRDLRIAAERLEAELDAEKKSDRESVLAKLTIEMARKLGVF